MTEINDLINKTMLKLTGIDNEFGKTFKAVKFPDGCAVIEFVEKLKAVIFWEYHSGSDIRAKLKEVWEILYAQAETAFLAVENTEASASDLVSAFIEELSYIRQSLLKDAQAGFEGDPAAKSPDEVILSYPGMFAVFVYRAAHSLHIKGLPFIPRMMAEYAHSKTGIDIHPGAEIGDYFFIDHGTSVVIGESTVIGNHVKLYQGVTLGALSTKNGQKLAGLKRHPTIEDNVTVYAGATILGGDTVIGENSVIGGNVFITKSVPKGSKVRPDTVTKAY